MAALRMPARSMPNRRTAPGAGPVPPLTRAKLWQPVHLQEGSLGEAFACSMARQAYAAVVARVVATADDAIVIRFRPSSADRALAVTPTDAVPSFSLPTPR